ncbi:MAG: DUF4214 domain-containing protein [Roseococcus sp.]
MSRVFLSGSLPARINENTPLWDWTGQLRLSINPALIRFVDVLGFGSNFFDVSLNRSTGVLTITPIAMADFEWFVANNISTTISFSLQFYMADGSVQVSEGTYSVTLLNIDDTPPQALAFATGGMVAAGAAGANIGRLLVTDPDTSSGFAFTIREDDQWIFEVVGDMLKLRSGVSIPLADGPERDVVITVSDGRQSAALTISIGVTALGINNGGTVDLLESHESANGFRWAGPSNLFSMRMSYEISSIRDYGSIIHIQLRDGSSVTVEQPAVIDLLDGYITFSGDSLAGRVWTIYETVFNRDPRHGEMASGVARLAAGTTSETLIGELLSSAEFASRYGQLSNTGFAEQMFRNSVGWTSASGVAHHSGNLDRGTSRASVVHDFVIWRLDSLNHADIRAANGGFFVPRAWVDALQTQAPGSMEPVNIAHWWASRIIAGEVSLPSLPEGFMQAQGILPRLDGLENASRLERLFTNSPDAPAESSWASNFSEALQKTGMTSAAYLQEMVKGFELAEAYANLLPQGVTFQAGW